MSIEEFKKVEAAKLPIGKLINIISKSQTLYLNHKLEDFDINSTQLHLLFEISNQNNINQDKIASRCYINKGAVARSIKKLEEKHLIQREIDTENRRQNKVSLTPKGEKILKESIEILNEWENEVFCDNDLIKKEELQIVLKNIAIKIFEITQKEPDYEQEEK